MTTRYLYFFDPNDPNGDDLLKIQDFVSKMGYNISFSPKDVYLMVEVPELIRQYGITNCLSFQPLNEEVLPDNTSRDILLDTLRYKLNRIGPKKEFLLIDPHLFPNNYDPDYIAYLISIFGDTLRKVSTFYLVTLPIRNRSLERKFRQMALSINSALKIGTKHTNIFHDRFWIADKERGLFVGTSLNGIGKRYAVVDYLDPRDAKEIYTRFEQIS